MDMFPDTALVRQIQQDLDQIIQLGVQNITRLIRANDAALASTLQTRQQANTGRVPKEQKDEGMDSSLAVRLVREGLLTPTLLRQLQKEWSKDQKQGASSRITMNTDHLEKGKRKKKKWICMFACVTASSGNFNNIQ